MPTSKKRKIYKRRYLPLYYLKNETKSGIPFYQYIHFGSFIKNMAKEMLQDLAGYFLSIVGQIKARRETDEDLLMWIGSLWLNFIDMLKTFPICVIYRRFQSFLQNVVNSTWGVLVRVPDPIGSSRNVNVVCM
jgi:hypothetical protein